MLAHERIWVALDTPEPEQAISLVRDLSTFVGGFKVGLQLFSRCGPEIITEIRSGGGAVFLDLKLHDIPNTVAGAAAALGRLGVQYFTVHSAGGEHMIQRGIAAASSAAAEVGFPEPVCLAVTVLTSIDETVLQQIGLEGPASSAVTRLAELAGRAGAGGIVCSPLEVARVRDVLPAATLVVPGIRPSLGTVDGDDQARTATPSWAVNQGADLLVIGRPITGAADPAAAAQAIAAEISANT